MTSVLARVRIALTVACSGVLVACSAATPQQRELSAGASKRPVDDAPALVVASDGATPTSIGIRPAAKKAKARAKAKAKATQVPSTTTTSARPRVHLTVPPTIPPTIPPITTPTTLLPPVLSPVDAVAYQLNARHTGAHDDPQLPPLLHELWHRNFYGPPTFPLIVGDVVYVAVNNPNTVVYALDRRTGKDVWDPVALGDPNWGSSIAYENGRLFVQNFPGELFALDAASGQQLWSTKLPGEYAFSSAPTALGGVVFTTGAGADARLYAVDESDGHVKWSQHVYSDGSPAVTSDGVYVATSSACDQIDKFDPDSGALQWHDAGHCLPGHGTAPVVYANSLLVNNFTEPGLILDTDNGKVQRTFTSWTTPVVTNGVMYTSDPAVSAQLVAGGIPVWKSAVSALLPPVIANGRVFVIDGSWNVHALSALTGIDTWSAPLAETRPASNSAGGLAEGRGVLAVAAASTLTVFG